MSIFYFIAFSNCVPLYQWQIKELSIDAEITILFVYFYIEQLLLPQRNLTQGLSSTNLRIGNNNQWVANSE